MDNNAPVLLRQKHNDDDGDDDDDHDHDVDISDANCNILCPENLNCRLF